MSRVRITERAEEDLDDIWFFIAQDNVEAADRMILELHDKARLLAQRPQLGRARDELTSSLRSLPCRAYIIFYRPIDGGIEIDRVLSGYRDLEHLDEW